MPLKTGCTKPECYSCRQHGLLNSYALNSSLQHATACEDQHFRNPAHQYVTTRILSSGAGIIATKPDGLMACAFMIQLSKGRP